MKKLVVTLMMMLCVVFASTAQNAVADDFYKKFNEADDAVTIDLSGSFLSFISSMLEDEDDEENFDKIAQDLTRIKIVSTDYDKVSNAEREDLKKSFLRSGFEEYAVIQEGQQRRYVMAKGKDVITEIVILARGEEKFSMVYLEGKLDPETLGEFLNSGDMNVKFSNDDDDN